MRKSDSSPVKETPEQELKRLRKENAKLKRQLVKQKDEDKAKLKEIRKELGKERKKKTCRK
ncbi:MAG: hypothetical protein K2N35_00780 [Muribaculaceae bacterium]|nr:hypothetical protein [Muribaculaceae bacterium]